VARVRETVNFGPNISWEKCIAKIEKQMEG
jgi:hypothetical protein